MASPISIMEAIAIVTEAVKFCQKVHNAPDEIRDIGAKMEDVEFDLEELDKLLNRGGLSSLETKQRARLERIMKRIKADAGEVNDILSLWTPSSSFKKFFFTVGKNPSELKKLMDKIGVHKTDMAFFLTLMIFALPSLPVTSMANTNAGVPGPLLQPPPVSTGCGILFVDPTNVGRSKVAEGYTKLLEQWTVRTGGTWPIKFAHSAGLKVRNRSDCIEMLRGLGTSLDATAGNRVPMWTSMASLFDNKWYNYQYKEDIKSALTTSRSRGITQNLFRTYDYILVFVNREYKSLQSLKQAFIAHKGPSMAPEGKGRIIHLGMYLSKTGTPIGIIDAPKDEDGSNSRANWNKTTSQIKLAIRAFLQSEMGWQQPPRGAQPG